MGRIDIHCGNSLHFSLHQAPKKAELKSYDSVCPYGAITRVTNKRLYWQWGHKKQLFDIFNRNIIPSGMYLVESPNLTSPINIHQVLWWGMRNGATSAWQTKSNITKIATMGKGNRNIRSTWSKVPIKTKSWLGRENEPWSIFFTTLLWGLHRYAKQSLLIRRQVCVWAC